MFQNSTDTSAETKPAETKKSENPLKQLVHGLSMVTKPFHRHHDKPESSSDVKLDPAIMQVTFRKDLEWRKIPGAEMAVISGDPDKAEPFNLLVHWLPGDKNKNNNINMSQPHIQPGDRIVMAVDGVCWMGTGPTFDPEKMVPLKPGDSVKYFANGLHYDGAKKDHCWMLVTGMGPIVGLPPLPTK